MDDSDRALLAAMARQIADLTERLAPARTSITFGELYNKYELAKKTRTSWETTAFALRRCLDAWRARQALSITPSDWTAVRAAAVATGLSESTMNLDLACVQGLLNWSVREKLLPENPLKGVRKAKLAKPHNETAPTEEENQLLLLACNRPIEVVLILGAADAGMRNGEARCLEWSWIDKERMEIKLPNSACKNKRGRPVPMTTRLLEAIEAMPRMLGRPYVLPNPDGEPYARETVCRWMREIRRRAGVRGAPGEEVTLHSLRHGFGTNAVERGVRIEVVQQIYGHASLDQTRDYIQPRSADLPAAREAFERGIKQRR